MEEDFENVDVLTDLVTFIFESLSSEPEKVLVALESVPRAQIKITVTLSDETLLGHILGKKYVNIRSVMQVVRSQQILPHDRYIRIVFKEKTGQELASFLNTDVSSYRKSFGDDYNFDYHQLRVERIAK